MTPILDFKSKSTLTASLTSLGMTLIGAFTESAIQPSAIFELAYIDKSTLKIKPQAATKSPFKFFLSFQFLIFPNRHTPIYYSADFLFYKETRGALKHRLKLSFESKKVQGDNWRVVAN